MGGAAESVTRAVAVAEWGGGASTVRNVAGRMGAASGLDGNQESSFIKTYRRLTFPLRQKQKLVS